MCRKLTKSILPLLGMALLTTHQSLSAAVIGYTNDFSNTGDNTAFPSEITGSEWTVSDGAYAFLFSNSSIVPSSASIPITGVASVDFVMETQVTVNTTGSINANGATVGFGLFSTASSFSSSGGSAYYLADWMVAEPDSLSGRLRILALGDTTDYSNVLGLADANPGSATLAITTGTTYTLRLTGTHSGGSLNMSLGVFDAAGTTQIGTSATAIDTSPLTGTHFGYRNRIGIGSGTFDADFDNFSVVPEPGSAALISAGALALLLARRRRRR